jgi:hypothetical protein
VQFRDPSVAQVLIGLHRVGIVGLRDAIRRAEASGFEDRERLVDLLMEELAPRNYIPEHQRELYRTAVWRELLRHRGEDISTLYSEIPVVVRGPAGEARDRFVGRVASALAEFELRPAVVFERSSEAGTQLIVRGEVIGDAGQSRRSLEVALRHAVSDW